MRRLLRKVRAKGGFSLVETLVAIAILAILTSVAALGTSQALQMRSQSIALADSQTVASTAAQVMTDQLRYGRIDPDHSSGDTVVFVSGTYGASVCMGLDEDGYLITRAASVNSSGSLVQGTTYALLGEDAYCGLCLTDLEFKVNATGETVDSVDVSFSVASAQTPGDSLWNLEFSVAPINPESFSLEEG